MTVVVVLVVTFGDDFHALAVQHEIHTRAHHQCHILEIDRLPNSGKLSWWIDGRLGAQVTARGGQLLDVRSVDAVWWRRLQMIPAPLASADIASDIITNDSRASLEGILWTEHRGRWINHPEANRKAENKLIQLRAAQRVGFRVPQTLVSQDPERIREFCDSLNGNVVIKSVRGSSRAALLTMPVTPELLGNANTLSVCPAIYQERIGGAKHIRANCFGERIFAFEIHSLSLDWRTDLSVPIKPIELDEDLQRRLLLALDALGLEMGIFDLKIDESGEPVWLEVNPQGQFLFLSGITGFDLLAPFADFLCGTADKKRGSQTGACQ